MGESDYESFAEYIEANKATIVDKATGVSLDDFLKWLTQMEKEAKEA
jgi:hypothetical protein